MDLKIEPKAVFDAYSTPIVQQTSFWSEVKERLGMHSCAFEYSVRNSDLYDGVGGFSRTNADFIMFYQYLNNEDYVAYVPYGPEIEPSEDRQGEFLEIKYVGIDMNLPDSGRRCWKIVVFLFGVSVFFLFLCLKHCYEYT